MPQLSLSNIVTVSLAQSQAGVGQYNTSNIGLFSQEVYADSFGTLGYNIYLDPSQVAIDFGTASVTYAMALAIFSQQPNILAGGGYLVIIPFVPQVDQLAFSGVAASGSYALVFPGGTTASLPWNATSTSIATVVQAVTGETTTTISGSLASQNLKVTYAGLYGAQTAVSVTSNTLLTSGSSAVTVLVTTPTAGETFGPAITRSSSLVQYFGLFGTMIFNQADTLAAAAVVQTLNKIAGFVSRTSADVNPGGTLDLLRSGGFSQSRGLYYGGATDVSALVFMASYFGFALQVNFSGSDTTITMHMKSLAGVQPDPSLTQSILNLCKTAGADVYGNFQGVAKVFCSNANGGFFDEIYNAQAFVGNMLIAGFNYLAQTATKIPQTEEGMTGWKGSYRAVCDQFVANQYFAPGQWNSATTFGNQATFLANILQKGYYIFSTPIAQQSQLNRANRAAPLVQIAGKEAGAMHSGSVIIYINA